MSEEIKKTEQNQTGTEDIAPDVSDLQSEAINTRKLQAVAIIAFMVVVLILLTFSFLHNRKRGNTEEKETHVGTKISNPSRRVSKSLFLKKGLRCLKKRIKRKMHPLPRSQKLHLSLKYIREARL